MLKHRGPILEHQTATLASPSDFSMETNPARIGWQEMRNLFYILRFDQKHKTNWHLTTWMDCAKRT
jgi:hypothetical protein